MTWAGRWPWSAFRMLPATAKTSTVLKTYAQAMRDRGFTVRAVAPTGTAAQTLATAISAESMMVTGLFLHGAEDRHDRNVVEIVDEASLTSARDMERLLARPGQRHPPPSSSATRASSAV